MPHPVMVWVGNRLGVTDLIKRDHPRDHDEPRTHGSSLSAPSPQVSEDPNPAAAQEAPLYLYTNCPPPPEDWRSKIVAEHSTKVRVGLPNNTNMFTVKHIENEFMIKTTEKIKSV